MTHGEEGALGWEELRRTKGPCMAWGVGHVAWCSAVQCRGEEGMRYNGCSRGLPWWEKAHIAGRAALSVWLWACGSGHSEVGQS